LAEPQEPTLAEREDVQALGAAQGLGCGIAASLVVFIGLGIFLDQRLDTTPLFILIGVALGLVGAGYQLYELTLIGRKDRKPGPLGGAISRRANARSRTRGNVKNRR
jgi:hypothetical protein